MMEVTVTKGSRIKAQWIQARLACLAGIQDKFGGAMLSVNGTVRHVRYNPDNPRVIMFFVDPDDPQGLPLETPPGCSCGHPHVRVDPRHVYWAEAAP